MKKWILFSLISLSCLLSCKKGNNVVPPGLPPVTPEPSFLKTTTIRNDGTFLVDGKPFFPFGAYGLGWSASEDLKVRALNELIASGFNISTVEDDGTTEMKKVIDNLLVLAENSGLNKFKLQVGVSNSPNITWAAQKYNNAYATFGYTIADDGDDGKYSIAVLKQREVEVKGYDKKHITFLTLTGWDQSRRSQASSYTSLSDAGGYQCYPIGFARNSDWEVSSALTQTYLRTLAYVQSATLVNKPMMMHLQTFNWAGQSAAPRYPTVAELRNMLYSGLAAGIKGVISYDFSMDLKNNQPLLWDEFKILRRDVSSLEAALMNGKLTRVDTGDQELVSSYWINNDLCYMVVVNTSYTASKNISIALPATYNGTKTSLFSRMPNTLSVSGTNFSGTIGAQEVQVYSIAK